MRISRRNFLHATVGSLTLAQCPTLASAQTFPSHPIRLVIPYPPGGVNDAVGRPWADKMNTLLGTVVVENMGGAGGSLGASAVARATPDGYTILLGNTGTQVIHPLAASSPSYDPIKSFDPVSILGLTAVGIAVNPSVPAKSLKEFIDYAKTNSAKLSYGSPGVGSLSHLTGELFKSLVGTPDILHVPYRGVGPAMTDLISARITLIFPNITAQVLEFHRLGKLRLLAVTSPDRLSAASEVQTAVEAGLPGMVSQNFIGLFAPAQTPKLVLDRVSQATRAALADLRQAYIASGFELTMDSNPEKARQFVKEEVAQWKPIIKAIGLKFE
jgi:tripartite-type tricarboxylate transporter receptor subunit TctC